jgi:hypothetical protein
VSNLKSIASINKFDQGLMDRKSQVLEKKEQDILEEEELDKLFFKEYL